jgi:hypothetical protein
MNWHNAKAFRCAVAAIFIAVAATSASADTHEPMSEPVTVEGVLTDEGVTCPALRGDDGELYTIAGDIGELQPGQRVRVTGEIAEMSICMQGTTITLGDITPLP